jgi:hypothetical protein
LIFRYHKCTYLIPPPPANHQSMKLYLFCHRDYRFGRILTVYDIYSLIDKYNNNGSKKISKYGAVKTAMDDDDLVITVDIESIKGDKYSIYTIAYSDFGIKGYNIKHITNVRTPAESNTMLESILSDINGCREFTVGEFVGFYKEEGYYSDSLPEHTIDEVKLVDIISEQIKFIRDYSYKCIAVSLYNGRLHDYIQIQPLF